jgi:hypothetical protein
VRTARHTTVHVTLTEVTGKQDGAVFAKLLAIRVKDVLLPVDCYGWYRIWYHLFFRGNYSSGTKSEINYYKNGTNSEMVPILRLSPRWHGTGTIFVIYLGIGTII